MKDFIFKIEALIDGAHNGSEEVDTKDGGYIVIADAPLLDKGEEGDHKFISAINGKGGDLLAMLMRAFQQDKKFLDLVKRAVLFASILPDIANIEKETTPQDDNDKCQPEAATE